jgi:hypothetical protein
MQAVALLTSHAKLSGAGLPWELHPACAAWPAMSPAELKDLADDIAAHGLCDPITLDQAGLLLDGRNRALACVMAGVEPVTVVYTGDPVLFSLSRNKHRRHMSTNDIAMVAAKLVTTTQGMNRFTDTANAVSIAQAADKADLTRTVVESAMTVLKHGTPEEKEAFNSGKSPRKLADGIRKRRRAPAPPAAPKSKPAQPSADPIDDVACTIIAKCSDGKWRSAPKIGTTINVAPTDVRQALKRLEGSFSQRVNGADIEFQIESSDEAHLRRSLAAKDREIADLKARIAELEDEIERLAVRRDASSPAPSPAPASAPSLDMVYS